MEYIADHHDNLPTTLTDNQKEVLEKFDDRYTICYAAQGEGRILKRTPGLWK